MARKPRIHYPGACYHVICRGNQGQRLFRDAADYHAYLQLLQAGVARYGCRLYAYVLMPNHVHHLLEVGPTPLSKIMQNVLFRYTRYWNRRYRTIGHLFQGRYKAILCEKEPYLVELIRYMHLNPVRSRLVRDPGRYAWSSHSMYATGEGGGWLAVQEVLPRWGRRRAEAVAAYQRFVRDGLREGHRTDLYEVVDQRYLGSETFVEDVADRVKDEERPRVVEIRWEEVCAAVLQQCHARPEAVRDRGRERAGVRIKRVMAWVGREVGDLTIHAMAKALGQDAGGLSRGLRRLAEEMRRDQDLQTTVQMLCETLRKGRRYKTSISHA